MSLINSWLVYVLKWCTIWAGKVKGICCFYGFSQKLRRSAFAYLRFYKISPLTPRLSRSWEIPTNGKESLRCSILRVLFPFPGCSWLHRIRDEWKEDRRWLQLLRRNIFLFLFWKSSIAKDCLIYCFVCSTNNWFVMATVLNQLLVRPFHLQSLHNQFHCHVTNTASKGFG